MNRPLRYLIPILLCINLITSCKKKYEKASERTDEALKQELNEDEVRAKLVEYAQKNGIETETFTDPEASGFALLSEIGFGHKPKYMKYVEKVQPIDSAAVRMAGWSIVQGVDVADAMKQLEPNYPAYDRLKQEYTRLLTENKSDSAQWVAESLNAYRWIHRQAKKSSRLVLVNIRGAYLVGMDSSGKVDLKMRVVAGKKDKATPGMDTYATQIITHPYWNVPRSIAVKEMLPKIQNNTGFLEANNIEVIDSKGNRIDPEDVDWAALSVNKFPYRLRQDTGADNSLGLLKVELKNPLAIYLHDTNARYLFAKNERWRSHGCVRVQRPTDLANFMAGEKLLENDSLEENGAYSLPPESHALPQKVPVFLLYLGADIDENGKLVYYKDVYGWDA
ncbi:L,D-transpeptidase family protein [Siphonobacter sp. SORGH_AS_1065]|uniref:L,D-transpeptidase family protein n=1 Tax=Siphonobacter sp. SORGH_AS_1065 TaxID=3041795 RepID=UPI0027804B9D|nr:L,D-transpeptidase family protein [Siphonobacter sp. SORGH_AS_1065]MDQ1087742.1 murein L,D-transpeptidase YcbB/YkuD [Siphonobacter sp. SORGH_AS_1065]